MSGLFTNYISFLKNGIVLIFLPSIITGFFSGKITLATVICGWLFMYMYLFKYRRLIPVSEFEGNKIRSFFIAYMLFLYIRGWGNIDSITDIYALLGANIFFCFLFPAIICMASPVSMYYVMRSFIRPGIFLCIICFLFPPSDGMMSLAHNASFLNVFILCVPFVKFKWKVIIPLCVLFVVFLDLERRSIMVNNVFPFLLIAFLPFVKTKVVKSVIFACLISLPIVFGYLAFKGTFNIFAYLNDATCSVSAGSRPLLIDSRSSIYEDVFGELKKDNCYALGLGCNGKTETSLTSLAGSDYGSIYKYGRPSTESGMLNYI